MTYTTDNLRLKLARATAVTFTVFGGFALYLTLTVLTIFLSGLDHSFWPYDDAIWFTGAEILATVIFAVVGANAAITVFGPRPHKILVTFAIFFAAFLTANGGGTLRDLMKTDLPFWLGQPLYVAIPVAITVAFSVAEIRVAEPFSKVLSVLDDFATAVFVCLGVHLVALGGVEFLPSIQEDYFVITASTVAIMTGIGGGTLRDVCILRGSPTAFRSGTYIPVVAAAVTYSFLFKLQMQTIAFGIPAWVIVCAFTTVALRIQSESRN